MPTEQDQSQKHSKPQQQPHIRSHQSKQQSALQSVTSYNTADFTNLSIADQLSIQKQKRNELAALNTDQKQQQLSHLSK